MDAINATIRVLQLLDRHEHFDSDGGGRITRAFYCEPYTAHKRVVAALKGSVYDAGLAWDRQSPATDPLYPWFVCHDVQVEPMHPGAVRAARPCKYNPANAGGQQAEVLEVQRALQTVDDFDAADLIDDISNDEVRAGTTNRQSQNDSQILNTGESIDIGTFGSPGLCGAKITATYMPLLFQPGVAIEKRLDYVDPQWEPVTITAQTGRSLFFWSPADGGVVPITTAHSGLSDTYAHPEVVWRFSIRRLMLPFLPTNTIGLLTNKVNRHTFRLGDLELPAGTVRMEAPDVITRRAPDGNMMFDLTLKFLVRRLYDEFYDDSDLHATHGYQKGWVGWNWAFGVPDANWTDLWVSDKPCYYPVVWDSSFFQAFGAYHPLFILDSQVSGQLPPGAFGGLDEAPFFCGFRNGD